MAILTVNLLEVLPAVPVGQNPESDSNLSFNINGVRLIEEYNETYHGFVHVSSGDPHYLEFDDGTPFFPVGINKGWINGSSNRNGSYIGWGDFVNRSWSADRYMQEMAAHNMNIVRIWMCSWHIDIENKYTGTGNYSESESAKLDYLLGLAEKYDLYVMLTLLTFTDFNTGSYPQNWAANPYNKVNGGPCVDPADFLTNETARYYIKKRFNYILDRWGDNPRIAMWEFWNEVDLVTGATDDLSKAWHEDVAQVFRQNDTHRRPLTTSFRGDVFWDKTYRSNATDIIQIHTYWTSNPIQLAQRVSGYVKNYLTPEDYGKPIQIGEYGAWENRAADPEHLHSGLWAAVASGALGSLRWASNIGDGCGDMTDAMFDRYLHFEKFVRGIKWTMLNINEGTGVLGGASNARVFNIQGTGFAFAWAQRTSGTLVQGAKLDFTGLDNNNYTVYVYDDSTGIYLAQYNVTVTTGALTVDLPDFTEHVAVKAMAEINVYRVPGDYSTIQAAINAANAGDTIKVAPGTYYEHVTVNKTLKLLGANRSSTIIDGDGTGMVVNVTAENAYVTGFIMQNSGSSASDSGLALSESNNSTISGNTIKNNNIGIKLQNANGNQIFHNNFINNTLQLQQTSTNTWDDGVGKGNYWDDYGGDDLDGDGIGDTLLLHQGVDDCPLMSPWVNMHDVAVVEVVLSPGDGYDPDRAYPDWYGTPPGRTRVSYNIVVVVRNFGDFEESFTVTAYNNSDPVGAQAVTLSAGEEETLSFPWDLTGLPASTRLGEVRHSMSANVSSVIVGETYIFDNALDDGDVKMIWPANTNGDDQVSIVDVGPLVIAWGAEPGDPNWDSRCDYNRDGKLDTWDVSIIIFEWGTMP